MNPLSLQSWYRSYFINYVELSLAYYAKMDFANQNVFEQRNARTTLAWAAVHNPFFVHGKLGKLGKFIRLLL